MGQRRRKRRRFVRNQTLKEELVEALRAFNGEEAQLAKDEKSKSSERRQPNRIQRYFKETIGELKKVNWPTRQEATNLTIIVLIVTFAMSIIPWTVRSDLLTGVCIDPELGLRSSRIIAEGKRV